MLTNCGLLNLIDELYEATWSLKSKLLLAKDSLSMSQENRVKSATKSPLTKAWNHDYLGVELVFAERLCLDYVNF